MTTARDLRRWRRYLAEEQAEARVYRRLARRRHGEDRRILLEIAEAEGRHETHWRALLGDRVGRPVRAGLRTRMLGWLASHVGSVFVLALMQRAEQRSPYETDEHATEQMVADEHIHAEVVRGLAVRGRQRISGTFRAAVFGANDGLVSNLALVLGMGATGVGPGVVLAAGVAGLLAGALSMGAGEFVSVRSQRELLAASTPNPDTTRHLPGLDVDANELSLVYQARGVPAAEADQHAAEVLAGLRSLEVGEEASHEEIGSALGAAVSSFCFFASGALVPVLPWLIGATGWVAVAWSAGLVGLALLLTGSVVGLLSGVSPLKRALRQLAIGWGAAAATYLLGLAFGTSVA
ncbi:VIT1/CCC1 transporter family protein [Desertihabitans brevis]|uniref:VIT1/CCC1 transporter family protein n=1 Tax=Desertihabitans brevis TaxID=2268447 RepID=UPI001F340211|nr:VIT1/CCC1 family protein [Desertihabitans brevis]